MAGIRLGISKENFTLSKYNNSTTQELIVIHTFILSDFNPFLAKVSDY